MDIEKGEDVKRLAIVIRDDAYDQLLTPLAFAYLGAAGDMEVNMLFVNWSVRVLSENGAPAPMTSGRDKSEAWLRAQVEKAGLPPDIRGMLKALKGTQKVRIYACSLAMQIYDVSEDELIPECDGVVGATWFLQEKAAGAHTQYF